MERSTPGPVALQYAGAPGLVMSHTVSGRSTSPRPSSCVAPMVKALNASPEAVFRGGCLSRRRRGLLLSARNRHCSRLLRGS